jgi:hypothetical protein
MNRREILRPEREDSNWRGRRRHETRRASLGYVLYVVEEDGNKSRGICISTLTTDATWTTFVRGSDGRKGIRRTREARRLTADAAWGLYVVYYIISSVMGATLLCCDCIWRGLLRAGEMPHVWRSLDDLERGDTDCRTATRSSEHLRFNSRFLERRSGKLFSNSPRPVHVGGEQGEAKHASI